MASAAHPATGRWLRPSTARTPPLTITNTTTTSSSSLLLRCLLSPRSASRVSVAPSGQSFSTPPTAKTLLFHSIRCLRDPGEFDAVHVENAEQSPGGSSGQSRSDGKDLLQKLKRYGFAGILSYGLLNTFYYLTAFVVVWFYFAPAPGRMGYAAAVERFLKLMAMVWAGSQVTKILRAGGALALAPFVERGLQWFTIKFNFESEGKAFLAIVGFCFSLAVLLFFGLTLLWA